MALEEYRRKRDFRQTPEPAGEEAPAARAGRFVVQKHHATRLHYDFRLEMTGVLKSWAVPKGPTLDPAEKRLAMMVEDHPMDYMLFEGIIPAGNYGAGTVMVWDTGTYQPLNNQDPVAMLEKGDLKFLLDGQKLKGEFALVRMRSRRPGSKGNEWLLLKKKDAHSAPGWDAAQYDWSATTRRSLEQIAADEGSSTWTSSKPKASPWERTGGPGRPQPASEQEMQRRKAEAARRTLEMTRREAAGRSLDPASLPGAVQARMPQVVRPMLATLVAEPQDSPDWLFEIKWDGVRAIAFVADGKAHFQSRTLRDLSPHYPDLARIAEDLRATQAVLDGEIVTLDAEGRSRFERLQQRMNAVPDEHLMRQFPVIYYVYDLIYLDGYDLRRVPLEQRKETLRRLILPAAGEPRILFSDHQFGEGRALWEAAGQKGLEGIMGKRRQSFYLEQRSADWQKIKVTRQMDCVVGGYTEPRRSREHFGSLVLGEYRDGKLVHVGNAGSGFTRASQKEAWEKLKPRRTDRNPFEGPVVTPEKPHWVRPQITARVKFTEWTNEGKMRAPVVLDVLSNAGTADGARNESEQAAAKPTQKTRAGPVAEHPPANANRAKVPEARRRAKKTPAAEQPATGETAGKESPTLFSGAAEAQLVTVEGRPLKIQNLGKFFFPEDGYTKRDVVEYYYRIADYLLPYMQDRPVSMKRYPDGINKPYFFQKEAGPAMPDWVRTVRIESEHGRSDFINFVVCNDRATLVYLANLGCIEQNLWMSRVGSLHSPDFVLFDLDPGDNASFEMIIRVAQVLRAKLDLLGLTGYPKTSGASGAHVYVPLAPEYTYDHSRGFAELVSILVAQEIPELVTQERSLSRRPKNRVYLDFVQNGEGRTVPPPYSLRARRGGPISTPLLWDEVKPGLDPRDFNLRTVWERLDKRGDLFAGTLRQGQQLESALHRLQEILAETELRVRKQRESGEGPPKTGRAKTTRKKP